MGDITLRLMWYVILSSSISEDARKMLTSFGSAYISALAFRDVWAFVGRPNLKGYTLYEDVRLLLHDVFRFSGISVFFLGFIIEVFCQSCILLFILNLIFSQFPYPPIPVFLSVL